MQAVAAEILAPDLSNRICAKRVASEIIFLLLSVHFVALMAQVAVFLPFTPVPVTGQTLGVILVGAVAGPWRGALAMAAYLLEGTAGLPVFAGGAWGLGVIAGPRGGYLLGFPVAALVMGWLARRGWDRRAVTTLAAMLLADTMIYICGLLWLSRIVTMREAFLLGLYPFILGDFLKITVAAAILPAFWKAASFFKLSPF